LKIQASSKASASEPAKRINPLDELWRRGSIETLRLRQRPARHDQKREGSEQRNLQQDPRSNTLEGGKPKRGAIPGKRLNPAPRTRARPGLQSLNPTRESAVARSMPVRQTKRDASQVRCLATLHRRDETSNAVVCLVQVSSDEMTNRRTGQRDGDGFFGSHRLIK